MTTGICAAGAGSRIVCNAVQEWRLKQPRVLQVHRVATTFVQSAIFDIAGAVAKKMLFLPGRLTVWLLLGRNVDAEITDNLLLLRILLNEVITNDDEICITVSHRCVDESLRGHVTQDSGNISCNIRTCTYKK